MKKAFAKCLAVAAFALMTSTAFAENMYSSFVGSVEPISAGSQVQLKAATPLPVADIVIVNWTNETIYETDPMKLTIVGGTSGRAFSENYPKSTIRVRFTIAGVTYDKEVYRRSTIDVRKVGNDYKIDYTPYDK